MIQLPKVLTGYFSTTKLNSAFTLIEDWLNKNVVHRKDGSAVMEQTLDMNGNPIINTTVGTDPTSLVNKDYVDRVLPGLEQSAAASATSAANSAAEAAISETNAANSEQLAFQHEQDALTHLKEFRSTYLGAYASAPTTDPDGNPVNTGDLYFDTTLNEMRVYDGSVWKAAGSTVNGTSKRLYFTGDGVTTIFTIPGGYDATFADVFVNGVKLVNGVDVDVSSGTDIVFTTAPANGDSIEVIAYGTFQLADMYTKVEIDSGTVVLNGIKNIDGSGSGLDADLLDGKDSTEFVEKVNLLSEITAIDGSGSGVDADLVRGLPADFSNSITSNGYQKLPSGLIIQWGSFAVAASTITITFPITFPNACLSVSNILYSPNSSAHHERT